MVTVLKVSKISKERPSKLYVYMRAFQFGLSGAQTEGIKVAFIQELKLAVGTGGQASLWPIPQATGKQTPN